MLGDRIVVEKRYPGERLDIREFVRPDTYMVAELMNRLPPDPDALYAWVIRNIAYPFGGEEVLDIHQECRYVTPPGRWRICKQTDDFWNYPSETLTDRVGDCDDKAFLLVSMLRHLYGPADVFATVGYWRGFGHVWVVLRHPQGWRVYETTLQQVPNPIPVVFEGPPYDPLVRFNDVHIVTVRPGPVPLRARDPEKTLLLNSAYAIPA